MSDILTTYLQIAHAERNTVREYSKLAHVVAAMSPSELADLRSRLLDTQVKTAGPLSAAMRAGKGLSSLWSLLKSPARAAAQKGVARFSGSVPTWLEKILPTSPSWKKALTGTAPAGKIFGGASKTLGARWKAFKKITGSPKLTFGQKFRGVHRAIPELVGVETLGGLYGAHKLLQKKRSPFEDGLNIVNESPGASF